MRFVGRGAALAVALVVWFALVTGPSQAALRATITRTAQDIPTIVAADYAGAGYGIGYAMAQDDICELAEIFTTLEGRRSEFFTKPADGLWSVATPDNVDSDYYHAYINRTAGIERMLELAPPDGPEPQLLDLLDGFVTGYNTYLARTGRSRIPDRRCRGKAWVRPITRLDVARRIYNLINRAGRGLAAAGIAQAAPPAIGNFTFGSPPQLLPDFVRKMADAPARNGSNAVALGSQATTTGRGILIGNPHWAWDGLDRFWQFHVKIPGELHASGATFLGLPMVLMGHNENVAFTSTVSASRRAALVRVPISRLDPMKYTVDGQVKTIEAVRVTIRVRERDGSLGSRSKLIYQTVYGPVTTSMIGMPLFPWTFWDVYSVRDAAQDNARIVNQFWAFNKARNVREFKAASDRYSANPWATETAADSSGEIYFGDGGAVPNVSNELAKRCSIGLGETLWNALGLAVLDGGRSSCDVPTDPDSVGPHIMPASRQPWLIRRDYATNSNEGPWLTNPAQPLEGFSRIFGPERTTRYARTRMGLRIVGDRLSGADGLPGNRFSRQGAQDALFNNRNLFAEIWREDLVRFCRANPLMMDLTFQIADVREACDVLAKWDGTSNIDSRGSVLFSRFLTHMLVSLDTVAATVGADPPGFYRRGFDVRDPVDTPSGLNTDNWHAAIALARAVNEFRWVGLPLDVSLRQASKTIYGGVNIPLHGNTSVNGAFNVIDSEWMNTYFRMGADKKGEGGGASFVMVTSFTGGCVDDRSLLLGSQRSARSGWPLATGQLRLYAKKRWVNPPFCDGEVAKAGVRSVTRLGPGGP